MIRAYCATVSDESDEFYGGGIVLRLIDQWDRCVTREFGVPFGGSGDRLSQIQILRFCLSSVRPGNRDFETFVYVDNESVIDVLLDKCNDGDDYYKEIRELKQWFGYYSNLKIKIEENNSEYLMNRAKSLAYNAANTQEYFDSEKDG